MEKLASFLAASEGSQASNGLQTESSSHLLGDEGGPFHIMLVGNPAMLQSQLAVEVLWDDLSLQSHDFPIFYEQLH